MKKHIFAIVAVLFLAGFVANAQTSKEESKKEEKLKEKEAKIKEKEKKFKEYDEIIIKRKTDKDTKLTIEIQDDEVMINGKPLDEYIDNEVSVRLRSPQKFNLNMNSDSPFRYRQAYPGDEEKAFFGVMTEGSTEGAKITLISENSSAAKAGLKVGDIITKVNNEAVYDHEQLTTIISKLKPRDKVNIVYKRDGKENKVTAQLGKRTTSNAYGPAAPIAPMPPMEFNFDGRDFGDIFKYRSNSSKPRIGIKVQDTEDGKGVKILDVDDESAAEIAGIKENDIITSFNGKDVNSAEELAKASRESKDKPSVEVKLKRDGKSKTVTLKIPKKLQTAEL